MRILTGIQASGNLHIGNYFGAIKPAVERQNEAGNDCFYFMADLHAFTSLKDPEKFREYQRNGVLDWFALGIDPDISTFYLQSDIAGAHAEMTWYLSCFTNMGLLERAHSYKDKKANGLETNVGLFTYPVLMAADILLYDAEIIPVGKDQKQHVEMARDIAQKVNHHFGSDIFVLPEPQINEDVQTIPGLDGRKMSKSYGNTIPLFREEKSIRKAIMSIETESVDMGTPLDPDTCNVMAFHRLFHNPNLQDLEEKYRNGSIGFGDSKAQLFELITDYYAPARERREKLASDPALVDALLSKGAEKARLIADKKVAAVRKSLGL